MISGKSTVASAFALILIFVSATSPAVAQPTSAPTLAPTRTAAPTTPAPTNDTCGTAAEVLAGPVKDGKAGAAKASVFNTAKNYPSAATQGAAAVGFFQDAATCYVNMVPSMCNAVNDQLDSAEKAAKTTDDAAKAEAKTTATAGTIAANAAAKKGVISIKALVKKCNATQSSPGLGGYANLFKMVALVATIAVWNIV